MNTNRKNTMIAGILYLTAFIAGILSIAPSIDSADYLVKAAANAHQILFSALSQLIMTTVYVSIAMLLYPILKKYDESLALGFLSFRIIAGAFVIAGVISLFLLLNLSREFIQTGSPADGYFQTLGNLLQTGRDMVNHVGMIISLSISSFMMYCLLFRTKLVPRWLSGWGLAGTVCTIFASLLVMGGYLKVITTLYMGLNLPLALQEFVLALWLIFRGFSPVAATDD